MHEVIGHCVVLVLLKKSSQVNAVLGFTSIPVVPVYESWTSVAVPALRVPEQSLRVTTHPD
jgi:hypothetical protein